MSDGARLAADHPYRHLLSPGRIGAMELRNRIAMCPMGDNLAHEDGRVSDTSIAYFEARARGGAGLLIVGSVAITHPEGSYNPNQSALANDAHLEAFAALARRVHAHGAKIAAQLSHGGITAVNDIRDGRDLWVPSMPAPSKPDPLMAMVTPEEAALQSRPMRAKTARVGLREMTKDDIRSVVDAYASAAERAQRAGLDGVELHAGHGYLISSFLSPAKNRRRDEYGGSLENRTRLLVEVIEAVRARTGREFALWCRIDSIEFWEEGGITPELAVEHARIIEAAGADAVHASANGKGGLALTYTQGHTTHAPAGLLEFAAAIKKSVRIPVIAVGRLEPEVADAALADGKADFVAMGRKLLADPELPNKLRAKRPERVRPCLYHYDCIGQIFLREPVRCWVNPATGREREHELAKAARARRVLVVGGGPAGMEAARIAALRGHDVTLCEAANELGGRFALAALTYEPNARMLDWLRGELREVGVDVRIGARIEPGSPELARADAVVVASGGRWAAPDVPGADDPRVRTVDRLRAFLDERERLGARVVVLGGGRAGAGLADVCARRGHAVAVLEPSGCFVQQMGLPGRWRIVHELREAGVELVANARVVAIEREGVAYEDAEGKRFVAPADAVLVASYVQADGALAEALRASGAEVHAIGDCNGPGFVRGAMTDAARVAALL